MVVDGLWTTDPLNPSKTYDYENGMTVSKVLVPRYEVFKTSAAPAGLVRFTWEGETGRHVITSYSIHYTKLYDRRHDRKQFRGKIREKTY